jgi:hypothetical protein
MKRKLLTIGLVATLMALTSGCALFVVGTVAAVGAGTYAYVKGESKTTVGASLDQTWAATLAVLKDRKYPIIKQGKDNIAGELTASNTTETQVYIYMKRLSDTATEISIRVGKIGDEAASKPLLEDITKRLQ